MNLASVRHPSVDTSLLMLIHSITPPLISTLIISARGYSTSSTIFTPGGSRGRDPYLPSGSDLSAVTQDKTELEFLSVDGVMKADPQSLSWIFFYLKRCLGFVLLSIYL